MRKPFSYMAAGLIVMGQAGSAAALGLGEIELHSALNQPLSANIRLLQADGLASDEILITLAAPAEFERAGIDRPALLSELRFVIATDAEGRRVIRVSSREPMREPYLDFLLEVQWPQGKMMREFTLLLDPPGYVMKQPVTPPTVRATPMVTPVAAVPAAAPVPPPARSEPASEGGGLHRVGSAGNTLWAIAKAVRPSDEVTIQQTMMALSELNPQAFIDGDINRIRRGALLQVPSLDQIRQRSASAAAQAVAQASQQRRQTREGVPAPVLTTTAPAPAIVAKAPDAELKLVAPSAPEAKPAPAAAGSSKKESTSTEELNQKLALTLENLDRLVEENKELKARQDEIGQQLQTMQKLLNLKDEQLAGLQAKLTAEQSSEAKPAAKGAAEPAESGLLARLLAEPLTLAASAAAVGLATLLAVLGLRRRAAQRQAVDAYPMDDFMFDDSSVPVAATSVGMAEAPSMPEPAPDASLSAAPQPRGPRTEPVAPRVPETADPLTEADIYLAYGRHEPAIALLTGAIEREPGRSDFWLKLLEIHAERKDRAAFDAAKQNLDALGDPLAIQRAAELKMTLGGAAATAEPELFAFTSAEPVEGGIDFSRIAVEEPAAVATAPIDLAPPSTMAPLDFDLAGSLEVAPPLFEVTAPAAEPSGGLPELEFEPGLFAPRAEPPAIVESAAAKAGEIDFEFDFGSIEPPLPATPVEVARVEDFDLATPMADVTASIDEEDMDLDTLHMRMREEMQQLLQSDLAGSAPELSAVAVPHPASEPLFRPHAESGSGFEDETFSLLAGTDENATRLDLARAYLDMGNHEGARELIDEVLLEGDPQQQDEARALLARLA